MRHALALEAQLPDQQTASRHLGPPFYVDNVIFPKTSCVDEVSPRDCTPHDTISQAESQLARTTFLLRLVYSLKFL